MWSGAGGGEGKMWQVRSLLWGMGQKMEREDLKPRWRVGEGRSEQRDDNFLLELKGKHHKKHVLQHTTMTWLKDLVAHDILERDYLHRLHAHELCAIWCTLCLNVVILACTSHSASRMFFQRSCVKLYGDNIYITNNNGEFGKGEKREKALYRAK